MSRLLMGALACLTVAGCTDVALYAGNSEPNLPNKISVQGDVCTDDPANVSFPVKVLVVMDGSQGFIDGMAQVMPPPPQQ